MNQNLPKKVEPFLDLAYDSAHTQTCLKCKRRSYIHKTGFCADCRTSTCKSCGVVFVSRSVPEKPRNCFDCGRRKTQGTGKSVVALVGC